jgi:ADP-ribose pyrophosphatase YjhB (NUDIX family)
MYTWEEKTMVELAVIVAVQQGNTVLLTKREDFEVWCLPGGAIDPGESPEVAAVREVQEETGLVVQLTRMVAVISRPHWGTHGRISFVFAAVPLGGTLAPEPREVIDIGYFPTEQLPTPLFSHHQQMITETFQGSNGQVWVSMQQMPSQFADRAALYRWRDASGLTRSAAYAAIRNQLEITDLRCVVRAEPGSG